MAATHAYRYTGSRAALYIFLVLLIGVLAQTTPCRAVQAQSNGILVVYYSRTGNSEIFAQALSAHLATDHLKITDRKNRSGALGFMLSALDSTRGAAADIEPPHTDVSPYKVIVLVAPIWNWKLCTPIRTFIETNNLQGKKVLVVTTANIDVKKYDKFGPDAPWMKRFLRNYLRTNRDQMRDMVASSGADVIGHYHIATQDKTVADLQQAAVDMMQNLGKVVHAWILRDDTQLQWMLHY